MKACSKCEATFCSNNKIHEQLDGKDFYQMKLVKHARFLYQPVHTTAFYKDKHTNYDPTQAITNGEIDRGAVLASARRVLKLMERLD